MATTPDTDKVGTKGSGPAESDPAGSDPAGSGPAGSGPAGASTSGSASAAPPPASYEAARDELAEVVNRLEEGGLTLDESLALWERGQTLAEACETFLAGARERVEAALAEPEDADD